MNLAVLLACLCLIAPAIALAQTVPPLSGDVGSTATLVAALANAKSGTLIEVAPGNYTVPVGKKTKVIAIGAAVFLSLGATPAAAWTHGGGPPPPSGCTAYAGDNGCSASKTYAVNPAFIDPNFATESAQSGQLPTSPTSGQLTTRNALIHEGNFNIPGVDYAIGSNPPSALAPVNTISDGTCAYQSSGATMGGGPYVLCVGTTGTETLAGYDFTNAGSGTGTACVEIEVHDSGTAPGVSYVFTNDYFKASGSCWSGVTAPGAIGAIILFKSSGGAGPSPSVAFHNVTMDGDFAHAPSTAAGRVEAIEDNREGPTTPYQWPMTIDYSVTENFGHLPVGGNNGGTVTIKYSNFRDMCQAGISLAHCEVVETTGHNVTRADNYTGNLYSIDSVQTTSVDTTVAFYLTSGQTSGTNYTSATVNDNVVVLNKTACTNAGPYSYANQCNGGTQNGEGLFSVTYDANVAALHVHANVIDASGAFFCADNEKSNSQTGLLAQVVSPGTTFTVTSPASNYANGSLASSNFWPGMLIHDTNVSDGFTDAVIASFGTYTNSGPVGSPVTSCTIGTNAGCGTMTLATSEPATASQNTWQTFASITTLDIGTDNYNIGGSALTARQLTFPAQPWGQVNCP